MADSSADKIRFACPTCSRSLNASQQQVEKIVQCPKCKAKLIVPYPQAAEDGDDAPPLPIAELAEVRKKADPAPSRPAKAKPKRAPEPEPEEEEEEEEQPKPKKKGLFSWLFGGGGKSSKGGGKSSGGGALDDDQLAEARSLVGKELPQEQKIAENASYRDTKIKEYTALCKLAISACQSSGQSSSVAGIQKIQTVCLLLMAGWGGMRPMIMKDPVQRMWLVGVAMMLTSGWKIMAGMVQVLGMGETSKDYPNKAKLLEDFGHVVSMAQQIQQKMGLG